jgi:hypothetical protein
MELALIEPAPAGSTAVARAHPFRVAIAVAVLCALLLEVTASFASHRSHGAPHFRTYPISTTGPVKGPRC